MSGRAGVKISFKSVYARWISSLVRKPLRLTLEHFLPFHAQAWKISYEPINSFLNEPDILQRDAMTKAWCASIQFQLNTVIIVVGATTEAHLNQFLPCGPGMLSTRFYWI